VRDWSLADEVLVEATVQQSGGRARTLAFEADDADAMAAREPRTRGRSMVSKPQARIAGFIPRGVDNV
jgi:hypothetical protein